LWRQISFGEDGIFPYFFKNKTYQYYPKSESKNVKVRTDLFAKLMLFWKRTENGKSETYNVSLEYAEKINNILYADYNYVNGKMIEQRKDEFFDDIIKETT
jgi:hypothetical protein